MKTFEINKTKPHIYASTHQSVNTSMIYEYRTFIMTRKFIKTAIFTGNQAVLITATKKLSKAYLAKQFIAWAVEAKKKGRYHDWMFQPAPTKGE